MLPVLLEATERHGHFDLAPEIRGKLLAMSAATIDRTLGPIRKGLGRRRRRPAAHALRSIPIGTSADWDDPAPGFVEADLVAHSGPLARGSFIQTLVLTDIATGWTECASLLVREQTLLSTGAHRIAQATALRGSRPGYGQRHRLHERDAEGLLRHSRHRLYALPPLTAVQLSALLEGLDWRRVHEARRTRVPARAG